MRKMIQYDLHKYASEDGWLIRREWGDTPNGNPLDGRWVLRNEKGEWVDFDAYLNDLADRNEIDLYSLQ